MSEEEDSSDVERVEPLERGTPQKAAACAFERAKRQLQFANVHTKDPRDLLAFRTAVQDALETAENAVRTRKSSSRVIVRERLCRAADQVRDTVADLHRRDHDQLDVNVGEKILPRIAPVQLQRWRPEFGSPSSVQEVTEVCAETGAELSEPPIVSPEDADVSTCVDESVAGEVMEKKLEADGAVRSGDFGKALQVYACLLNNYTLPVRLRGALLGNAALCTLKLSPEQISWPRACAFLRRTLAYCDEALRVDATNPKLHFRRGSALEALGDHSGAQQAYDTASRYAPSDRLIQVAMDRNVLYTEGDEECGTDRRIATARARLTDADPHWQKIKAWARCSSQQQVLRQRDCYGAYLLNSCCSCGASGNSEIKWYANPCGHGPFCVVCRNSVEAARDLLLCPICRRQPGCKAEYCIVSEWREGEGQFLKPKAISTSPGLRVHQAGACTEDGSHAINADGCAAGAEVDDFQTVENLRCCLQRLD